MKKISLIFTILFISASMFAQIDMRVKTTDGAIHSFPITEVDSVYYVENSPNCGTIIDFDGNTYQTITIGTQCWMAENLKVTHYPNGDTIPLVTYNPAWGNLANDDTSDAMCYWYNNTNSEADTYGALYTYAAAIGDNWARDNTENQGVCPDGWHLPTDDEWKELEMYLGMNQSSTDSIGFRGTNEGSKLAGNATLWVDGDLEQNANFGTSGFSALPGGFRRLDGPFLNLGYNGIWWSATDYNSLIAYSRWMSCYYANVGRNRDSKSYGFSVRCVSD